MKNPSSGRIFYLYKYLKFIIYSCVRFGNMRRWQQFTYNYSIQEGFVICKAVRF